MAASIVAEQLLESSKCLVLLTLCHFSTYLSAEKDVAESMFALSLNENNVLYWCQRVPYCAVDMVSWACGRWVSLEHDKGRGN